jgi:hypothetical protein
VPSKRQTKNKPANHGGGYDEKPRQRFQQSRKGLQSPWNLVWIQCGTVYHSAQNGTRWASVLVALV